MLQSHVHLRIPRLCACSHALLSRTGFSQGHLKDDVIFDILMLYVFSEHVNIHMAFKLIMYFSFLLN